MTLQLRPEKFLDGEQPLGSVIRGYEDLLERIRQLYKDIGALQKSMKDLERRLKIPASEQIRRRIDAMMQKCGLS